MVNMRHWVDKLRREQFDITEEMLSSHEYDTPDVRHVCPFCGGQYAANHGALIVVEMCKYCHGVGDMSSDELERAVKRYNDEQAKGVAS